MKPFVGAVVHFVNRSGYCLPGLVTVVSTEDELPDRDPIGAVVFNENGTLAPETGWRTYRGRVGETSLWHWPSDHDGSES